MITSKLTRHRCLVNAKSPHHELETLLFISADILVLGLGATVSRELKKIACLTTKILCYCELVTNVVDDRLLNFQGKNAKSPHELEIIHLQNMYWSLGATVL